MNGLRGTQDSMRAYIVHTRQSLVQAVSKPLFGRFLFSVDFTPANALLYAHTCRRVISFFFPQCDLVVRSWYVRTCREQRGSERAALTSYPSAEHNNNALIT